jgi:hypothetical protein
MTTPRPARRTRPPRPARHAAAATTGEAVAAAADAADAPDVQQGAGPVEALVPARQDEPAAEVERVDEREAGSMQSVARPGAGGGIPGFVEPPSAAGEDGECPGDPWH